MAKDSSNSLMTLGLVAVGGYVAYEYFLAPAAATTTSGTPAPGGTVAPGAPAGTPPIMTGSWPDVYARLIAATLPDTQFTGSGNSRQATPHQWNFYLERVLIPGQTSSTLPDLSAVFPGVDLTGQMTAATYWNGMGGALGATGLPAPVASTSDFAAIVAGAPGVRTAPAQFAITPRGVRVGTPAGSPSVIAPRVSTRGGSAGSLSGLGGYTAPGDGSGMGFTVPFDASATVVDTGATDAFPFGTPGNVNPYYDPNAQADPFAWATKAPAAATGLAAVPWWAWAAGAALLFIAMPNEGRRR